MVFQIIHISDICIHEIHIFYEINFIYFSVFFQWGTWGPCSKSCGKGVTKRRRECSSDVDPSRYIGTCTGRTVQQKDCEASACNSK